MKLSKWLIAIGIVVLLGGSGISLAAEKAAKSAKSEHGKKSILLYSPSFGFRHSTVARPISGEPAYAEKMLKEIAEPAGYEVFVSQDFHDIDSPQALKKFDVIIFYTTGNPTLNRDALMNWIREGGAFIGIHCAADTFYKPAGEDNCNPPWPEYTKMIGASFQGHNKQTEVVIKVEDHEHMATKHLPMEWKITDEMYRFNDFSRDNVHVLLSIDTEKLSDKALNDLGMKKGGDYAVSWTRTEEKGRVFYTSLGHREDVWTNPLWQKHLLGGIAWALEKDK